MAKQAKNKAPKKKTAKAVAPAPVVTTQAMAAQCSNCFFVRQTGANYFCHHNSPGSDPNTSESNWPQVNATDWCGDGWDPANGIYCPDQLRK
jgi:hypothetical protein